MADHIHLELPPDLIDGQQLQRPGHDNARIVDQAGQSDSFERLAEHRGSRSDGFAVGNIQERWGQPKGSLGPQSLRVCRRPDSGENAVPLAIQLQGARLSDAGQRAGNQHRGSTNVMACHGCWKAG